MMRRVYYSQTVDWDGWAVGSPGPMFSNPTEAEKYAGKPSANVPDAVHTSVVYDSVKEYYDWLDGKIDQPADERRSG